MVSMSHKQSLVELISELPTREKIAKELAEKTMSEISTVYRWMAGTTVPPAIKQKAIAEYFNKPVDELFPKN